MYFCEPEQALKVSKDIITISPIIINMFKTVSLGFQMTDLMKYDCFMTQNKKHIIFVFRKTNQGIQLCSYEILGSIFNNTLVQ